MKIKQDMQCMTEGCNGKPICRKLCSRCYYRLLRRVQRGTAMWGDLVNAGECSPAKRYHGMTTAVRRQNALEGRTYQEKHTLKAAEYLERNYDNLLARGFITEERHQELMGRING